MRIPNKGLIEHYRKQYPKGTRVRLLSMDDVQAPPEGTLGTVIWVDDMASLIVEWDNGCTLNAILGEDIVENVHE